MRPFEKADTQMDIAKRYLGTYKYQVREEEICCPFQLLEYKERMGGEGLKPSPRYFPQSQFQFSHGTLNRYKRGWAGEGRKRARGANLGVKNRIKCLSRSAEQWQTGQGRVLVGIRTFVYRVEG